MEMGENGQYYTNQHNEVRWNIGPTHQIGHLPTTSIDRRWRWRWRWRWSVPDALERTNERTSGEDVSRACGVVWCGVVVLPLLLCDQVDG